MAERRAWSRHGKPRFVEPEDVAQRTVLEIDRVRALAYNADVFYLGRVVPERARGGPGRRSEFPAYMYVLYAGLTGTLGSARRAEAVMKNDLYWMIIKDGVRYCLGSAEADALPEQGPSRNQWNYHSARLRAVLPALLSAFRDAAVRQAVEQGLLDPNAGRDLGVPLGTTFVAMDGTAIASPIRGRKPQEAKPRRVDSGAGWYREAGEDNNALMYATKFVLGSARADAPRSRVVLDVRHQQPKDATYKGEAGLATAMLLDLVALAPGIQGVCYDGALRGVHRDQLMKAGLLVVSPQHSGAKPMFLLRSACACGQEHDLWTEDGDVTEQVVLNTGALHREPLTQVKLERRGHGNVHRWYRQLRLRCGQTIRVRLDGDETDEQEGFNRAEHLRQYPPGSASYEGTYGWREDAESLHSTLDSTLWNRRMIAFSAEQQSLVVLGFALGQNSNSRAEHRKRGRLPKAAAA